MSRPARPRGATARLALVSAAVALPLVLAAAPARADEPVAPEADTNPAVYPPPSARPNLILVGAAVTVGWYGAAYGTSYLWPNSDGAKDLRVPIIGPYQALAKTGCGSREPNCGTFTLVLRTLLTGFTAVGQTGGVLAMLEGVFVPTRSQPSGAGDPDAVKPRQRLERPVARETEARVTADVTVAPTADGDGVLLGVFGNF